MFHFQVRTNVSNLCVDISEMIYTCPNHIAPTLLYQTLTLARMWLHANVSSCLMEANHLKGPVVFTLKYGPTSFQIKPVVVFTVHYTI